MNNLKVKNESLDMNDNSQTVGFFTLLKSGYRFEFNDGNDTIVCWGSTFTGKESIYLNNKLVSQFRNMTSRKSTHSFIHKGHKYEVEFDMVSISRGQLHCIVIKDGVHFQTKKMCPSNMTNKKPMSFTRTFIEGFVFGAIGFAIGFWIADSFKQPEATAEKIGALVQLTQVFFG